MTRFKCALLLLALTLFAVACGGAGTTDGTEVTTESLTPVARRMNVTPGTTVSCTGTYAVLYEDPNATTPLLTAITLIKNTGTGYYDTSTYTAVEFLSAAQWSSMCATIDTPGRNTRAWVTYDNDAPGTQKTFTQPPTFLLL